MNLNPDLTSFTKINSKRNNRPKDKKKNKNIKFLTITQNKNLDEFRYSNDFLDSRPKACSIKKVINKPMTLLKFQICALQKTMSRE